MITAADVDAAADRLSGRTRVTPVLSDPGGGPYGGLWWKLEHLQHTGSFKVRGALNRLLAAAETGELSPAGVVAASGGNAGLAVAHAARELAVPAHVYLPGTAPAVKVRALRALGAAISRVGSSYAEAAEAAAEHAAGAGTLLCHPYDQPEVCAGQGTVGRELLEQVPGGPDTVLVACGGGGLMAGVATAVADRARVVAVEPESIRTLNAALAAGAPVEVPVSGVAADSLGAARLGGIAMAVATGLGVRSVLVTDDDIVAARRELWSRYRLAVEHGTATAAAALFTGAYRPAPGERVAVVCCGGNTDPGDLAAGDQQPL